jgi:FKBP-type peptidyl-prolyl cis-trans isomerase (trigger factor)
MAKGPDQGVPRAFPADYPQPLLAGKTAQFNRHGGEIKKKVLPTLADAFVKDAFHCETVAELRAKIKEDLQSRREAESPTGGGPTGRTAHRGAQVRRAPGSHPDGAPALTRHALDRLRQHGADPAMAEDRQKFHGPVPQAAERNVRMS